MKAVKFYSTIPSDDTNILLGISGKIPAEVIFTDTALDETYTLMTDDEYLTYLQSIQPELDEWKQIQKNIEYN